MFAVMRPIYDIRVVSDSIRDNSGHKDLAIKLRRENHGEESCCEEGRREAREESCQEEEVSFRIPGD